MPHRPRKALSEPPSDARFQALRESEQRLRQLLETVFDYTWELDEQHRLIYASPAAFHDALYGVPLSKLLGKRVSEHLGVRFEPEMGRRVLEAIKARQPYRDIVFSIKHADGHVRWAALSGMPMFNADGEFQGYRGVGAEITARVEAETAARLAQRRLHDAVAYVSQPFVVYDPEDRAAAFNQAFTDLFRTPTTNSPVGYGLPMRELAEWQVKTGFFDQPFDVETLLAHHHDEREHTFHLRDGRWMLVIHRVLPGGGRVGLWTDITAIKRAEEDRQALEAQLHHSQRLEALGTLAGGVAHELNNTLVPLVALTKIVARRLPEGGRDRGNLETVVQASERARDLVKQILTFSRKQNIRHESVDLAVVMEEALCMMRAALPSTIRVEQAIAPTPPLQGDPGQLHQTIINLLTNAAQAIGETHGTITVGLSADADGAHIRLSVSDTGCGMDEGTRERIFEPFFTTKGVGHGTGLGLAVVHGIVASHGGRIEVTSEPSRGTRLDVVFPIKSDPAETGS